MHCPSLSNFSFRMLGLSWIVYFDWVMGKCIFYPARWSLLACIHSSIWTQMLSRPLRHLFNHSFVEAQSPRQVQKLCWFVPATSALSQPSSASCCFNLVPYEAHYKGTPERRYTGNENLTAGLLEWLTILSYDFSIVKIAVHSQFDNQKQQGA